MSRLWLRVSRHDGFFAGLTGFERPFFRIEPQAALLLFRPVTFETMLFQQWTHLAREIRRRRSGGRREHVASITTNSTVQMIRLHIVIVRVIGIRGQVIAIHFESP